MQRVRRLVTSQPELFRGAGEWIERHYRPLALWRRHAVEQMRQRKAQGLGPPYPVDSGLRVGHPPVDPLGLPSRDRWESKLARLQEAFQDLKNQREVWGHALPTRDWSLRAILVTWLITDPYAHTVEIRFTSIQDWDWSDAGNDPPRRFPDEGRVPRSFFYRDGESLRAWFEMVEEALEVLEHHDKPNEPTDPGVEDSQLIESDSDYPKEASQESKANAQQEATKVHSSRSDSGTQSPNRFLKKGRVWHISFGKESGSLPHSVGLQRIKMLIERQGQEVRVEVLVDRKTLFRGDPASDNQAMRESKERRNQLRAMVESECDPFQVAEAREELEKIERHLSQSTGLRGKARKLGDEGKAAASSVGKSIERALVMIGQEGLRALADHLREAIVQPAGMSPAYRPTRQVDWMF